MITTNLTLTNGVTSETPIRVVGITFEVDSKLAVNPSVVFPLDVAIDSSEIIGIDFDETLYTGDYTESITINTLGGRNDIAHTVDIEDTSFVYPIIDITFDMTTVGNQHFLDNAQGDDFLMYTGAGANLAAGQEIVVPVDGTYQTICYMLDGVVHYDTGSFFAGDYTINKIGIVQNFFFYDGILTTEEKTYLEYYPDRFIYKNGDVLDSGILTPSQIALVRAYFPMCEEGDFIVDASKGDTVLVEYVQNGTFDTDSTGWNEIDNPIVTVTSGVCTIEGTESQSKISQYNVMKSDTDPALSVVLSGDISYVTDTLSTLYFTAIPSYIKMGTITPESPDPINAILAVGDVGIEVTLRANIGTATYDNISVKGQIDNKYYITNYAAEVRSTANMLTYGLTAFTERDNEGVVL